jgi:hypothetical protein
VGLYVDLGLSVGMAAVSLRRVELLGQHGLGLDSRTVRTRLAADGDRVEYAAWLAAAAASYPWRTYRTAEYGEQARGGKAWTAPADTRHQQPSHAAGADGRSPGRSVAGARKSGQHLSGYGWRREGGACRTQLRPGGRWRQQRAGAASGTVFAGWHPGRLKPACGCADAAGFPSGFAATGIAAGDAGTASIAYACATDIYTAPGTADGAPSACVFAATGAAHVGTTTTYVGTADERATSRRRARRTPLSCNTAEAARMTSSPLSCLVRMRPERERQSPSREDPRLRRVRSRSGRLRRGLPRWLQRDSRRCAGCWPRSCVSERSWHG